MLRISGGGGFRAWSHACAAEPPIEQPVVGSLRHPGVCQQIVPNQVPCSSDRHVAGGFGLAAQSRKP